MEMCIYFMFDSLNGLFKLKYFYSFIRHRKLETSFIFWIFENKNK